MSPTPATSMPAVTPAGGGPKRPTRSRGIEVPDLVGRPAAGCVAELRRLGLKPNSIPEPVGDPEHAGMVVAQEPAGGEFVPANTRVRLEIGDHSLFDARQYAAAPQPVDEPDELAETAPAALEPADDPQPWLSYDRIRDFMLEPLGGRESGENPLESRWDRLAEEHSLGPADDPFADAAYPGDDFEAGHSNEAAEVDAVHASSLSKPSAHEPRWTRRQRRRALLSLCVLLLLACTAVVPHLAAHAGPVGRHSNPASSERTLRGRRVLTVTVTTPTPVPAGRVGLSPRSDANHAIRGGS